MDLRFTCYINGKELNNREAQSDNTIRYYQHVLGQIMSSQQMPDISPPPGSWWTSTRFRIALVGFLGFMHIYAQRVAMSMAIVCMVNQTAVRLQDDELSELGRNASQLSLSAPKCAANINGSDFGDYGGVFIWDKTMQGHLLGAFFYGYLAAQIPAGWLAERYSGKWVMFIFISLFTLTTLLTPLAAKLSWVLLFVLRVIAGFGSGAAYPCMMSIWSKWAPKAERTKLTNITFAGSHMGIIITMPLSGFLCKFGFAGGWPSIFYIIGISSMLWLVLWVYYVTDHPHQHKSIKPMELAYISASLQDQCLSKKLRTPWLQIITSGPVWAIIISFITEDWGLYTFLTNVPTYMNEVLKFDVEANGLMSALPFIGLYINMNISPFIADYLISSGKLRIITVRRIMMVLGGLGAAIFIIALAYVDCSQPILAVSFMFVGISLSASTYSGSGTNPLDIAPQHAATIFAIANCIASVSGFGAPAAAAALTTNRTAGEWQIVFFISAGAYLLGAVGFCVLGSGEVQSWARKPQISVGSEECSGLKENEEDVELHQIE